VHAAIWMRAARRTTLSNAEAGGSAGASDSARRIVALERVEAIAFPSGRGTSEEAALASRGIVVDAAQRR